MIRIIITDDKLKQINMTKLLLLSAVIFFSGCTKEYVVNKEGDKNITSNPFESRFEPYLITQKPLYVLGDTVRIFFNLDASSEYRIDRNGEVYKGNSSGKDEFVANELGNFNYIIEGKSDKFGSKRFEYPITIVKDTLISTVFSNIKEGVFDYCYLIHQIQGTDVKSRSFQSLTETMKSYPEIYNSINAVSLIKWMEIIGADVLSGVYGEYTYKFDENGKLETILVSNSVRKDWAFNIDDLPEKYKSIFGEYTKKTELYYDYYTFANDKLDIKQTVDNSRGTSVLEISKKD